MTESLVEEELDLEPDSRAAALRQEMRKKLSGQKRRVELYTIGAGDNAVEVEIREISFGERNDLLAKMNSFSESKKGRAVLKRHGITEASYQNIGLVIECVYIPGTDERLWTSRKQIPQVLDLGSSVLHGLQRKVFEVLGLKMPDDVEEVPDATDEELTEAEKN